MLPNSNNILNNKIIYNSIENKENFIYNDSNNVNMIKVINKFNQDYSITGNVLKINDIDSTTSLYSYKNLITLEEIKSNDSTIPFNIDISYMGTINNFLDLTLLEDNAITQSNLIVKINKNYFNQLSNNFKLNYLIK